jgi:hypothetical protein
MKELNEDPEYSCMKGFLDIQDIQRRPESLKLILSSCYMEIYKFPESKEISKILKRSRD